MPTDQINLYQTIGLVWSLRTVLNRGEGGITFKDNVKGKEREDIIFEWINRIARTSVGIQS